ncbi:MAG TPA: hypothetical protein VKQ72_17960 [Aggregatilineales bacterium]|nr:hypothetical protein [Aggregatilineales bacterium]
MLLLVYQPLANYTPGLTAFGDFPYFYTLAQQADQGKLIYRDYWYEQPPIIGLLLQGAYLATESHGGDFSTYTVLLVIVLTAFDAGNLLLLRRIGTRLYGPAVGIGLAWVYMLLAIPLIDSFWTFDCIVAFFTLLAVNWLLAGRQISSALANSLGALTKLVPLLLLGAVWRFRPAREALRYTAISGTITVAGLGAILLIGGPYGVPSLTAQFTKASAETVWALMDGNYKTGNFSANHFDPAEAARLQGNPPAIPAWLRTGVFAAIGLFIFLRTRRRDARGVVAFVAITFALFCLWSANWSPQWLVWIIPLALLNFPDFNGLLLCVTVSLVSLVEYPLLFAHTTGEIPHSSVPLFALLVSARTVLLAGFALSLYRKLRIPIVESEG